MQAWTNYNFLLAHCMDDMVFIYNIIAVNVACIIIHFHIKLHAVAFI